MLPNVTLRDFQINKQSKKRATQIKKHKFPSLHDPNKKKDQFQKTHEIRCIEPRNPRTQNPVPATPGKRENM
jgi:hypothetical protein